MINTNFIAYPTKHFSEKDIEDFQSCIPDEVDRIIKLSRRLYLAENEYCNSIRSNKNKRAIAREIDQHIKRLLQWFGLV